MINDTPMRYFIFFLLTSLTGLLHAQTQGDKLRSETRLDQVYSQYNLNGEGVIVALIERGIDYEHPDFIDENGDTRIAYIFDMVDPSGANDPENPYGVGTIYSRTQIDAALDGGDSLPTMDRFGHGIACTGLAAGDGSAMAGAPYRGVAHGATIISVKVNEDYFPPTGNIAGQNNFFDPSYIPIALQFVADKAEELGLPCVALLNLGSIGGPTDGSSEVSRAMADFAAPGRILVCGVGDDGGSANRAIDSLATGDTLEISFRKATTGNLRFDAWYENTDQLELEIDLPNGSTVGTFSGPATEQGAEQVFLPFLSYYHQGSDVDFSGSNNSQRQILIDFKADTGTYVLRFIGTSISDGKIASSLNPARYYNSNGFLSSVFDGGSINDYASAYNVIVPTDYVYDSTYTDIDGFARHRGGQGAQGDLWIGSSAGPTLDGRLGVDVAVPGELNIGAYTPGTYYSQFAFNIAENSNGYYGLQNAVSAAAPILTGFIALMLEVNPNLTYAQVQEILHQTARSDAFTGAVPNRYWGYGKLDALAAIEATQQTVASIRQQSLAEQGLSFYPNPAQETLTVNWRGTESTQLYLLDAQGRVQMTQRIERGQQIISLPSIAPGVYWLRLGLTTTGAPLLIR